MLVSDRGGRQHRTDHKVVGGRGRNVEEYLNARENGVRFCLSKADLEPNFRAETQVSSVYCLVSSVWCLVSGVWCLVSSA